MKAFKPIFLSHNFKMYIAFNKNLKSKLNIDIFTGGMFN